MPMQFWPRNPYHLLAKHNRKLLTAGVRPILGASSRNAQFVSRHLGSKSDVELISTPDEDDFASFQRASQHAAQQHALEALERKAVSQASIDPDRSSKRRGKLSMNSDRSEMLLNYLSAAGRSHSPDAGPHSLLTATELEVAEKGPLHESAMELLLRATAKNHNVLSTMEAWRSLLNQGVKPTGNLVELTLKSCVKSGALSAALVVLKSASEKLQSLDRETLVHLLAACAHKQVGDSARALQVLCHLRLCYKLESIIGGDLPQRSHNLSSLLSKSTKEHFLSVSIDGFCWTSRIEMESPSFCLGEFPPRVGLGIYVLAFQACMNADDVSRAEVKRILLMRPRWKKEKLSYYDMNQTITLNITLTCIVQIVLKYMLEEESNLWGEM